MSLLLLFYRNGWSYEEVETTSATNTGDLSYTVVCRTNFATLKSIGVIVEVGEVCSS